MGFLGIFSGFQGFMKFEAFGFAPPLASRPCSSRNAAYCWSSGLGSGLRVQGLGFRVQGSGFKQIV